MDRGTWHAAVHGLTESWTKLSDQVAAADPDKPRLAVTTITGQKWNVNKVSEEEKYRISLRNSNRASLAGCR